MCDGRPDGGTAPDETRVLVLNPTSGTSAHVERIRTLAAQHGFTVQETEREGQAIELAAAAASDGASVVAAAGGDGTLNEVVRGLVAADALGDVVFGVIPAGTGNNFAGNVGIESVEHGFDVIEDGTERDIDLGFAGDRPFLNSCIGGLTAQASSETTSELKADLGVVAYVLTMFRTAVDFEGTRLRIETDETAERAWQGTAVLLLVGNGRRFPSRGQTQADVEDGLLDVAIIEKKPGSNLAGLARSTARERLLGADADHVTRVKTAGLTVRVLDDDPTTFSLDGEEVTARELAIEVSPASLRLRVGEGYEPHPEG
nr:diacylglycerol kinase family protein [Halorientalis brevis]